MLQLQSVEQSTYKLLQELSKIDEISNFALAGGTALALYFGHRVSIDLDFFTINEFDTDTLLKLLQSKFEVGNVTKSNNSLTLYIKSNKKKIKIDFLRHNYPILSSIITQDAIRFFSVIDIAAMKLNAIANRGAKKDFFDLYELLDHYSLLELLDFYERKYKSMNVFGLIKSLTYFEDANIEPNPISLNEISWEQIKSKIEYKVRRNI